MAGFSSFIYHKILGWKIVGDFQGEVIKKCMVIVVPHTSWHDFYIGLLVRKVVKLRISFLAKKELFKWPFGWYFKKVGGIPLDRTPGQNKVEAIAEIFRKREELRLAIAPEGTRKRVKEWKTGFYHIAKEAKVPIIMVTFDFAKKQNVISEPFYPTDDIKKDFEFMYDYFKGVIGKKAQYSFNTED
ncbi:1-acyl-sn-glycerol-3-phosphate acyltransferase [Aquimarina sp. 2201CG5-10]|uniref:1-acyl-sn-glycerol-3-phosphate acyltransferase n=1 Tax=Aquimarina callyspongiae TaxID=3098150 RepID=UPI002AB3C2C7|nr:1-acyl-sn-glycerol-3-phosphate acyltransferase [Aquimarina sp. 2201CG5-10]MDY8136400.1 1-acyl-sn-glycerol-3-phosphate acyltransferase [Aquimarina sp. 2201CG5-10]